MTGNIVFFLPKVDEEKLAYRIIHLKPTKKEKERERERERWIFQKSATGDMEDQESWILVPPGVTYEESDIPVWMEKILQLPAKKCRPRLAK